MTRDYQDRDGAAPFQIDELPSRIRELIETVYYKGSFRFRRASQYARWRWFPGTLAACAECGAAAQWCYVPSDGDGGDFYCDDCVPRGCECNIIGPWTEDEGPDAEQHRDKQGRLLPCCEYWFGSWGWPRSIKEGRNLGSDAALRQRVD